MTIGQKVSCSAIIHIILFDLLDNLVYSVFNLEILDSFYFPIRKLIILQQYNYFVSTLARHSHPTSTHQNDPQAPQITGLVVAIIFEDLRCCVLQCEAGSFQELIVWWFEASKAKVYDLYLGVLTLVCEEQILQGNSRQQSSLSLRYNWSPQVHANLDLSEKKIRLTICKGSNNYYLLKKG